MATETPAERALRANKTQLQAILRSEPQFILDKVQEMNLITRRDYDKLTDINKEDKEGYITKLLDKIRDRGEKTSEGFLQILQTDSVTHQYPKLKNIQWDDKPSSRKRAAHDPSPITDGPGCSKSSRMELDKTDASYSDDDRYKFTRQNAGLCLIINNKTFDRSQPRDGTDNDAVRLARTFKSLGFRVLMCEDQKKDQMLEILGLFSSLKSLSEPQDSIEDAGFQGAGEVKEWSHSDQFTDLSEPPHHGDAFVCCILSHGKSVGVCGTDEDTISKSDIIDPFSGKNCPALLDKPKLFFIQACRGTAIQEGVPVYTDGDEGTPGGEEDTPVVRDAYYVPEHADFLFGYATIHKHASSRLTDGTWYITALCKELEYGCDRSRGYDILRILTRVANDVSKKVGTVQGQRFTQIPVAMTSLRRLLFFHGI